MDGFQKRREQKSKDILEAALALFMEYGVQKVSIAEIAGKAKVSQVTIYNYFESKNQLAHEVVLYYVDQVWNEMNEVLNSDLSYPEKIKLLIFNKKENASQIHEDFYRYFMKEYAAGNSYIEKFYIDKALPRLVHFFEEGKKMGYVNPNISNEAILLYFQMFKDYLGREEVYSKVLPIAEDLTRLCFYGIIGQTDIEQPT
ncbi:TetR/AcrR family transcriptional regulator [Marinicrinis lubricantis]